MSGPRLVLLTLAAIMTGACGPAVSPTGVPSTGTSGPAAVSAAPSADAASVPAPAAPTATPLESTTGGTVSTPVPTPTPTPRFALTSSAFADGGAIPRASTCDGADTSPELAWTGVPAAASRLVLLVEDPDARDFAHWIAFSIQPTTTGLARGAGAAGSDLVQGTNDFGRVGYGGPCPPSGTHHYRFTLYAVADPLGLDGNPRASTVRAALATADILGTATLTATYRRGG